MNKKALTERMENFYSAEMTAYLRCRCPQLSMDSISDCLVSPEGRTLTINFMNNLNYSSMANLISVRAGFFQNMALKLLKTGNYDTCISIGSGFSLLLGIIAHKLPEHGITYIDSDIKEMLEERNNRIKATNVMSANDVKPTKSYRLDISNGNEIIEQLKLELPKVRQPLFILEGLSYFMPKKTLLGLLKSIAKFYKAAVILDVCSIVNTNDSQCLQNLLNKIPGYLHDGDAIYNFGVNYKHELDNIYNSIDINDASYVEKQYANEKVGIKPRLVSINDYVPTKFLVMKKHK